ncbi:MAG: hypothetical protein A2298_01525 [Gammaproteobacteria bacterium RIFOXYB2_FULL_38_6]|nr:MAG: hypothetical protein A2298_01525 [Gammaproteobacteria bacterium RIFOXYB2_FULL_38_6]
MHIKNLYIQHFRNIVEQQLSFSNKINIFFGKNGAGKTSLLEAIYYLSTGHSFRVNSSQKMIQYQTDSALVRLNLQKNTQENTLGIKFTNENRELYINGEKTKRMSLAVQMLPILAINVFNMRFFVEGPTLRRKFLDWGAFHQYSDYPLILRQFNKIWQQRNSALKNRLNSGEVICWDSEFVAAAELIHQLRQNYTQKLETFLLPILQGFLQEEKLSLSYKRGWDEAFSLSQLLRQGLFEDFQMGYTKYGPHRADINLYVGETLAQDYLSQGQQKVAAYAFYLSQGHIFKQQHTYSPIFLIDDLPAELDVDKRGLVAKTLNELDAQIFITGVTQEDLESFLAYKNCSLFHVEQGKIVPVE